MKELLLLATTLVLLSGCGPSRKEYEHLQKQYEQVSKRAAELEAQVSEL